MAGLMPKVFEEASLSGELRLSGRKLKDFPKTAAKYNLSDTVIADLSRNRLCELPEDVTGFPFLETLLMYHNSLRSIPESIRGLYSLSFLDLRRNLLTSLPRELCFLPIEVLLVSNNRLISLPDELGRMTELTELDAACNQITHLPARMSDLKNLKSLSLRNNQLVYLPRDITGLKLVSLDVSCNRIASLPVELRHMTDLVRLELSSNPLTSPPASLCIRGLVHVFKYLDTMALKEEKTRNGGTYDGNTTLRRNAAAKHCSGPLSDLQKIRRQNVDSGYSTSDGYDKRWSQELTTTTNSNGTTTVTDNGHSSSKWSPTMAQSIFNNDKQSPNPSNYSQFQSQTSGNSTPTLTSPVGSNNNTLTSSQSSVSEYSKTSDSVDNTNTPKRSLNGNNREYKEALRQQRNQDAHAIYRPKEPAKDQTLPTTVTTQESPPNQNTSIKSNTSTPTSTHIQNGSNSTASTNSSLSPQCAHNSTIKHIGSTANGSNTSNGSTESVNSNVSNGTTVPIILKSPLRGDKPIQKVTPSRNSTPIKYHPQPQVTSPTNGNVSIANKLNSTTTTTKEYNAYIKPNSPAKQNTINCSNGSPATNLTNTPKTNGNIKSGQKSPRSVSWNRDSPAEKLSFTMRREFDRQKEESELIEQLRKAIESRLKMTLPKDVGSALTDGVVLCHLANHVRPRSVGSIHVPSPAVPKLTMARCRRNVDNFLDACRKIGVDEELICSCADIVPADDVQSCDSTTMDECQKATMKTEHHDINMDVSPPNVAAMYRTVAALLSIADFNAQRLTGSAKQTTNVTNTTNTGIHCEGLMIDEHDSYNRYFKQIGIHFQKSAHLLLDNQPTDPCKTVECEKLTTTATTTTTDADHFNEYSLIVDFDCSASNDQYDTEQYAMQSSSLCCSTSTNPTTTTTPNLKQEIELASNINNSICYNTSISNNNNVNKPMEVNVVDKRSLPVQTRRKTPNTLNLILSNTTILNTSPSSSTSSTVTDVVTTKKRKLTGLKRTYKQMSNTKYSERFELNGIIEECEYDSDIGKFNCKVGTSDQLMSDTSSGSYEFSEETATIRTNSASSNEDQSLNDLNLTPKHRNNETNQTNEWFNLNKSEKIVMKRIEFFENINNSPGEPKSNTHKDEDTSLSTFICLSSFILSLIYIFFYPLSN
ncbi:leucine-rich repeat and calponin homology domain-containing protein isoform X3 [Contarinia nasturtii]|uniref:leucine-rich repeat and calponin homology domain-containing protein isoform X3 n=1 Tax=Contarinia nasturtii TaxID=265458 RepID=UPI0012D4BE14|nr:leucine-rich repeat and calponin homology domain-containing protein isoform X3 [Contarinia nasturtii]